MAPKGKVISVFSGSSYGNDKQIIEDIKELGRLLGTRTERVLYGGGLYGHLQDLMEAVGNAGGKMDAVLSPAYFDPKEIYPSHVNVIKVQNDQERIEHFLKADAFIVTPGGDGTTAESMFAHNNNLSALFQNKAQKPVIFMNTNGFYSHLIDHFKHMSKAGYSNDKRQRPLFFEPSPKAVIARL
jgi:uncharacterized protein (TIGR00730 family)